MAQVRLITDQPIAIQVKCVGNLDFKDLYRAFRSCKSFKVAAEVFLYQIGNQEITNKETRDNRSYAVLRDRLQVARNNNRIFAFFMLEMEAPYVMRVRFQREPSIFTAEYESTNDDEDMPLLVGNQDFFTTYFSTAQELYIHTIPNPNQEHRMDLVERVPNVRAIAMASEGRKVVKFFPRSVQWDQETLNYPADQPEYSYGSCVYSQKCVACFDSSWPVEKRILLWQLDNAKVASNIASNHSLMDLLLLDGHLIGAASTVTYVWKIENMACTQLKHQSGDLCDANTRSNMPPGFKVNNFHQSLRVVACEGLRIAVASTTLIKLYQIEETIRCTHEFHLPGNGKEDFATLGGISLHYPLLAIATIRKKIIDYSTIKEHLTLTILDIEQGKMLYEWKGTLGATFLQPLILDPFGVTFCSIRDLNIENRNILTRLDFRS